MKANELMIDDWVYNKNIDKPMQVYPMMFSQMFRTHPDATAEDYNIFPIPLTAEILEKNGWKKEFDKKPYMTFYHLEDEKYWLMWCISEHTLDIQRQNKTLLDQYNLCAERVVIACDYVHQLQHALRLCGIDKDIVL